MGGSEGDEVGVIPVGRRGAADQYWGAAEAPEQQGKAMSGSEGGPISADTDNTEGVERSRSWWIRVVVASLVAPVVMSVFAFLMHFTVTNSLDPAHALGVSDTTLLAIIIAIGGLLAGVAVGLIAGVRQWQLILPTLAAVIVGPAIMLVLVAAGVDSDSVPLVPLVYLGQSAGILIATTLTGYTVLASIVGVVAAGIGIGLVFQPAPEPNADSVFPPAFLPAPAPTSEPNAELSLVLTDNYSVNPTTGECSGSGDFSSIVEGSTASLVHTADVEALGPIVLVLRTGFEITWTTETAYLLWNGADTGCLFELNDQELGASAHEGTFLFPEGLGGGAPQSTSGHRVVFLFDESEFLSTPELDRP